MQMIKRTTKSHIAVLPLLDLCIGHTAINRFNEVTVWR